MLGLLAAEASNTDTSMETHFASGGGGRKERLKRNRKICIYFTILLLLLIFIVFLILGFTIFKPKRLITTFDSIAVEHLQIFFDPAVSVRLILNLTLHVNLSLKNPSHVGFSYDSSSVLLNYKSKLIGEAPLPANRIGPEETQPMNLTLTLMADRLLSESQLFNDLIVGVIPLNTFVKVSGKVRVLKIFKLKVQSSSSCDLAISILNRNVTSQNCTNQIK